MTNNETETAKQKAVRRLKEKLRIDRYYGREYKDKVYFFDSEKITEEEFKQKFEYDSYTAFEDSLEMTEILELLNRLSEENESLKAYNKFLSDEKMLLIKEKAILKENSKQILENVKN